MGCTRAYKKGLLDAAQMVEDYAEERRPKLKVPTPSDDIVAALRVAAAHIRGDKK